MEPLYPTTPDRNFEFSVEHVALAKQADLVLLAPATANVIGKIANGIADDMLTTTVMACTCKVLVAPAMNHNMYHNSIVQENLEKLKRHGYEIEPFGGKEYAITAIPADFTDIDMKTMFIEMLDDFANISGKDAPNLIMEKVASMSCKAAVKGNNHLSRPEIEALIDELLELDNPYNCPHGRPTIISMTKYEIEKKFRRIV